MSKKREQESPTCVRLSPATRLRIESMVFETGVSQSDIIREAVDLGLASIERRGYVLK